MIFLQRDFDQLHLQYDLLRTCFQIKALNECIELPRLLTITMNVLGEILLNNRYKCRLTRESQFNQHYQKRIVLRL